MPCAGVAIFPSVRTELARRAVEPARTLAPHQAVDMLTLYNECWQVLLLTDINCIVLFISQITFYIAQNFYPETDFPVLLILFLALKSVLNIGLFCALTRTCLPDCLCSGC